MEMSHAWVTSLPGVCYRENTITKRCTASWPMSLPCPHNLQMKLGKLGNLHRFRLVSEKFSVFSEAHCNVSDQLLNVRLVSEDLVNLSDGHWSISDGYSEEYRMLTWNRRRFDYPSEMPFKVTIMNPCTDIASLVQPRELIELLLEGGNRWCKYLLQFCLEFIVILFLLCLLRKPINFDTHRTPKG